MPSDTEELQAKVEALETSLAALRRKMTELDDFAQTHLGFDWGTSLIDANSPHPNLSVDTLESGGGVIRQDLHGMQVETQSGGLVALYFIPRLSANPSAVLPRATIAGESSETSTFGNLELVARGSSTASATVEIESSDASGGDERGTINAGVLTTAGLAAVMEVRADDNDNTAYVRFYPAIKLSSETADPSVLEDGMVLYRSDTDRFRGRANGATDNFAMEGYVDAHTGDTSDAHDASAISVLDTGGNFTGTDVEAVLAELAAASGGGMTLIVKAADETVNGSATLQNDDELLFAVAANTSYQFEGVVMFDSGTTPDFQMTFTGPSGATGSFGVHLNNAAGFSTVELGTTSGLLAGAATRQFVRFYGGIANGGNAGNCTLQWAQNTSDASDTIVHAGSYLKYQVEG